jgi:DNA-binding NarL/FixJ family response regulator
MSKIKLAIVEDHESTRKAMVLSLKVESSFEVVLLARNGVELLEQLKSIDPDIVLMDIRMPEMNGVEAKDRVKEFYPKIKIIAYTQYDFEDNIVEMYSHGVKSFIGKEDHHDELFKAIRIVHNGGAYMTNRSAEIIQRYLADTSRHLQKTFDEKAVLQLSNMELKVLWHTSHFKSIKQIAEVLFVSSHTIRNHQANIRHKLKIKGRGSLLQYSVLAKELLAKVDDNIEVKK